MLLNIGLTSAISGQRKLNELIIFRVLYVVYWFALSLWVLPRKRADMETGLSCA